MTVRAVDEERDETAIPWSWCGCGEGEADSIHADGLGSIVAMTDQGGSVTLTRQYDAWGNLEVGADQAGFSFTGREWDPEIGLYYYRARYYDPKVGRFISEDPVRFSGGINFYAYVRNNPANLVDPDGLQYVQTATDRVRGQYSPYTGEITFEVTVANPFTSEFVAAYIHEYSHKGVRESGAGLPEWRDEQLAMLAELGYLDARIKNLETVEQSDCRADMRASAKAELEVLRERRSEADAIGHLVSEAKRYEWNRRWGWLWKK
jgi:RHS repeat-associated protein